MSRSWIGLLLVAALVGCREEPRRIENANLGIVATFPGEPRLQRHTDATPFGDIEWFDLAMSPGGRLDETFSVAVGNLPRGDQGGTTPREILGTFQNWLTYRLGPLRRTDLPEAKGPGFRYQVSLVNGGVAEGIVVCRQGRIYYAQAIVGKLGDPRAEAFLNDFEVTSR